MPLLVVSMLGAAEPQVPRPSAKPGWVESLPQGAGRIYAVGTADLGTMTSESQAITRATDRARLEVITRLRADVKGQTLSSTKMAEFRSGGSTSGSGYGERRTQEDIQVGARAEDIPGLAVEATFVDQAGRTAYALAYLDLDQARSTLQTRLDSLRSARRPLEKELTRRARWRLRKMQGDLARLNELTGMLAGVGGMEAFRGALETEREAVDRRLTKLETADLPAMDLKKCAMALRINAALPAEVERFIEMTIGTSGLKRRETGTDFALELDFAAGPKGPQFITAEPLFVGSILYKINLQLRIVDASGVVLAKASPIALDQDDSASGLIAQFRKQFERRWGMLLDQLQGELQ